MSLWMLPCHQLPTPLANEDPIVSFDDQKSIVLDNVPYMNAKIEDLLSLILPYMIQYQEVKTCKKLGPTSLLSTQDLSILKLCEVLVIIHLVGRTL